MSEPVLTPHTDDEGNLTKKYWGWAADNQGCGYYRIYFPVEALQEEGGLMWEVDASGYLPPDLYKTEVVLIGQRVFKEGNSNVWSYRHAMGLPNVYELDDLLWAVEPENKQAKVFNHPLTQELMRGNMERSDLITVSTEALKDEVERWVPGSEVVVLPNMIPQYMLDEYDVREPQDGPVVIGYPAGTSHARDALELHAPLTKVLRKDRGKVEFHSIGYDYRDLMRVEGVHVPAVDFLSYYDLLEFDILVAPLRPSRFNLCKSPIKVMEAAARGIPAVASNYGPYAEYVSHGYDGFLCDTPKDWENYLRLLISDPELRLTMGRNARSKVESLTYEKNAHLWKDAWDSVR